MSRSTDLIAAGAVDALASDYVPAALIEAAFTAATGTGIGLPAAVAMITDRPARMARLADRGRLEAGLRADLVRARRLRGHSGGARGLARRGARGIIPGGPDPAQDPRMLPHPAPR